MNEKSCTLIQISVKMVLQTTWHQVNIGSGNGLVPKRQQAITWTNAALFNDAYMGTRET